MRLSIEEGLLFYKLYPALLFHVNQKLQIVEEMATDLVEYLAVPGESRLRVRNALHADKKLLDGFIEENPAHLAPDELAIVASWKQAVVGSFYIFRHLKKYTVFLDDREPPRAYGVIAVADEIQSLLGDQVPILTQAVLLPFKGKIIYDGLLASYRVSFGPGIRRRLSETYQAAKGSNGIITSLPLK